MLGPGDWRQSFAISLNNMALNEHPATTETSTSEETQCQFFLSKKKRLCRFKPKIGQKYCPEHACILGITIDRKRIPCPLNPNHNCYEDELQKHMKKCNVTKSQQACQRLTYYVKAINRGSHADHQKEDTKKLPVRNLSSQKLQDMIVKVNRLYKDRAEKVSLSKFEHPCVEEEYSKGCTSLRLSLEDQAILRKELLQQAALVGQLENLGLLSDRHCYVEMGAGKGKLSHWVQKAIKSSSNAHFLLVDRSSVRYKMDAYHRQLDGQSNFKRIKIDIEDLCLGLVPEIRDEKFVVVIGKHLCGGATDMGIRCAVNTLGMRTPHALSEQKDPFNSTGISKENVDLPESSAQSNSSSAENSVKDEVNCSSETGANLNKGRLKTDVSKDAGGNLSEDKPEDDEPETKKFKSDKDFTQVIRERLPCGIMIALCCHHRCTWDTYLGQEFMKECDVSPEEFDLMTRLSSWATCCRVAVNKKKRSQKEKIVEEEDMKEKTETSTRDQEDEQQADHATEDLLNFAESQSYREKLTVTQREDIGRQCKRLIDTGRIHFLRSKGMSCCLREYISEDQTPENVVLIAQES